MLDDLLSIGDRVVALAQPGEQVEAVVVHGRDTEIRVYEGVSIEGYLSRPNAEKLDERTVLIRAESIFELAVVG